MILQDLTGQKFNRLTVQKRGPNTKWSQARWWCLCDCGGYTLTLTHNLIAGHAKSCGCWNREVATRKMAILRPTQIGDKSPNWNPNLTIKERDICRDYPEYKEWRFAVYERDQYTCQKCGDASGGNLNAHHIEGYAGNIELRTEVLNGITFCKDCHKNFHHQYGYGNNTREQLNIFLGEDTICLR